MKRVKAKSRQTSVKIAADLAPRITAVINKYNGVTMATIIHAGIERVLPEFEAGKVTLNRKAVR